MMTDTDTRDALVAFRLRPRERRELQEAADREGTTVSDFIRERVLPTDRCSRCKAREADRGTLCSECVRELTANPWPLLAETATRPMQGTETRATR